MNRKLLIVALMLFPLYNYGQKIDNLTHCISQVPTKERFLSQTNKSTAWECKKTQKTHIACNYGSSGGDSIAFHSFAKNNCSNQVCPEIAQTNANLPGPVLLRLKLLIISNLENFIQGGTASSPE